MKILACSLSKEDLSQFLEMVNKVSIDYASMSNDELEAEIMRELRSIGI